MVEPLARYPRKIVRADLGRPRVPLDSSRRNARMRQKLCDRTHADDRLHRRGSWTRLGVLLPYNQQRHFQPQTFAGRRGSDCQLCVGDLGDGAKHWKQRGLGTSITKFRRRDCFELWPAHGRRTRYSGTQARCHYVRICDSHGRTVPQAWHHWAGRRPKPPSRSIPGTALPSS